MDSKPASVDSGKLKPCQQYPNTILPAEERANNSVCEILKVLLCRFESVPYEHMASLKELLKPLAQDGASLTREQAAGVLEEILAGGVPDVETAALLTVLATRGELAPELAGFVQV